MNVYLWHNSLWWLLPCLLRSQRVSFGWQPTNDLTSLPVDLWGRGRDAEWALGVAGGEGCRDERRGSSASEVGTDDGTEKKKEKKITTWAPSLFPVSPLPPTMGWNWMCLHTLGKKKPTVNLHVMNNYIQNQNNEIPPPPPLFPPIVYGPVDFTTNMCQCLSLTTLSYLRARKELTGVTAGGGIHLADGTGTAHCPPVGLHTATRLCWVWW